MAFEKSRRQPGVSAEERRRRVLWQALVSFGLVEGEMPPPKPDQK
jgi:hypothetical protein